MPAGLSGWQGRFKHSSPEVVRLRKTLAAEAGIKGLELVSPAEPGFAARAARLPRRLAVALAPDARVQRVARRS